MLDKSQINKKATVLWMQVREQVGQNTRLRMGVWLVLLVIILQPLWLLQDARASLELELVSALQKEAKVMRTASERAWLDRAEQAQAITEELTAKLADAATPGEAKASLQQWLVNWSSELALADAQISLDEPASLDSLPGHLRVSAQLNTRFSESGLYRLLEKIEKHQAKIIVERVDIDQRQKPRMRLYIVAYFKLAARGGAGDVRG